MLDASDVVLHQPSTDAPETLAGALGNDFEGRLRRIYERARTVHEIEAELRRLREEMDEERKRFEQTWARTAGLIETRFDQRVRQMFRRLQADLPEGLARFDSELDQLITGFLRARDIPHRRVSDHRQVGFALSPSVQLPDGWRDGGTVGVGHAKDLEDADPLHLGHPLVQAAVAEAREATQKRFCVAWVLNDSAPQLLKLHRGKRGYLVLIRVRYEGFERVDRLVPIAVLEGESVPLEPSAARWLLNQPPRDRAEFNPALDVQSALDDAIEELLFVDQSDCARFEQQRFERSLEQIERYIEDQLLVLRRRLSAATPALRASEDKRDTALGSEARSEAEERIRKVQKEIDEVEAQIGRLENRDDPEYERWRKHAHERRYRPPATTRILDVEFILE